MYSVYILLCVPVSINWYQSSKILGKLMVSTRGMEARLEALERGFEGLLAERENLEKNIEQERLERLETWRQLNELMNFVRELSNRSTHNEFNHEESRTVNDNDVEGHVTVRRREERWRKLEIPVFEGEDAYGWINRVERYFELKGMEDVEKLQAVMVAMEGKALTWYQWWEFCAENPTWNDFRSAVIRPNRP